MPPTDNWAYGKAVVDREVQYFSPSAMTMGDSSGSEGCQRAYVYQYVLGKKRPSTPAAELGTALHAEIEGYQKGTLVKSQLGPLAAAGLHMVPDPGADLLIEQDIATPVGEPSDPVEARLLLHFSENPDDPAAREVYGDYLEEHGSLGLANAVRRGGQVALALARAPLRVAGVPVVGRIDLCHHRATNKGASDVGDVQDPPGTVEVIDWKSTRDPKYIKAPLEMARTIQMTTYGKWVTTVAPEVEHVRLSHGYFITKGPGQPRKVSLRVHKSDIDKRWEHVERLAGSLVDAARVEDVDQVPANLRACGAYGGCFHRPYCRAANHNSLADLVGQTAADRLKHGAQETMTLIANDKSLTAGLKAGLDAAPSAAVLAEMNKLAAGEAVAKRDPLLEVILEIESSGLGFPSLVGQAAAEYARVKGMKISTGAGLAGSGELAKFTLDTVDKILAAAPEVKQIATKRAAAAALLPPDAPASNPALASKAPEPSPEEKKAKKEAEKAAAKLQKEVEKAAAKAKKDAEKANADAQPEIVATVETVVETVVQPTVVVVEPPKVEQVVHLQSVTVTGAVNLFVDCSPEEGATCRSLWPVIDGLTAHMAKAFDGDDYRTTDPNGKLGFGRWKGVLASLIRDGGVPPGNYSLAGAASELGAVVVEAMRGVVRVSGGMLVRGAR